MRPSVVFGLLKISLFYVGPFLLANCQPISEPSLAMGVFGAMMQVEIINEGPVTILLDTDEL
jgi:D-Tyr-tRNAtyr deacylase